MSGCRWRVSPLYSPLPGQGGEPEERVGKSKGEEKRGIIIKCQVNQFFFLLSLYPRLIQCLVSLYAYVP